MTNGSKRNISDSVRQRLKNKAQENNETFDQILLRFTLERLLYRLSQSKHRDQLVLKGAMLFQIWSGQSHRPTRDLDFLGQGTPSPSDFERHFREICEQEVDDDGLKFFPETVHAEPMKEDQDYQGLRLKFQARLESARILIQIDVGFGDAVTPRAEEIKYPTLLEFEAPVLKAYPRETVVAEKLQAMVNLGIANSRMKDFFDLWTLSNQFEFSGSTLSVAIKATFERRQTLVPEKPPLALTSEFASDSQKQTQWNAFLRKNKLETAGLSFAEIIEALHGFLMPPIDALANKRPFDLHWRPSQSWRSI